MLHLYIFTTTRYNTRIYYFFNFFYCFILVYKCYENKLLKYLPDWARKCTNHYILDANETREQVVIHSLWYGWDCEHKFITAISYSHGVYIRGCVLFICVRLIRNTWTRLLLLLCQTLYFFWYTKTTLFPGKTLFLYPTCAKQLLYERQIDAKCFTVGEIQWCISTCLHFFVVSSYRRVLMLYVIVKQSPVFLS